MEKALGCGNRGNRREMGRVVQEVVAGGWEARVVA